MFNVKSATAINYSSNRLPFIIRKYSAEDHISADIQLLCFASHSNVKQELHTWEQIGCMMIATVLMHIKQNMRVSEHEARRRQDQDATGVKWGVG